MGKFVTLLKGDSPDQQYLVSLLINVVLKKRHAGYKGTKLQLLSKFSYQHCLTALL